MFIWVLLTARKLAKKNIAPTITRYTYSEQIWEEIKVMFLKNEEQCKRIRNHQNKNNEDLINQKILISLLKIPTK